MNSKSISIFENYPSLKEIPSGKFPNHLLIIPDGNGRWAKQHSIPVIEGHRRGADVTEKILRDLSELKDIKIVTLWGFSADNWKRTYDEIHGLMMLLDYKVSKTLNEVKRTGRRFIHLGRKDRIPRKLLKTLNEAEEETKNSTGQIICLAIDFGGIDQELRVLEQSRDLDNDEITIELLWKLRDGQGLIPSADLLIRSANERRTSDIGWLNGISTELYFIDKLYPDISTEDIVGGLIDFSGRERRFGARVKNNT